MHVYAMYCIFVRYGQSCNDVGMGEEHMTKYTVAVAGATGYAGGEALRILTAHPAFEVTTVAGHSSIGHRLGNTSRIFRNSRI